eukprot:8715404-Prorocentrum_lima.AAC.1
MGACVISANMVHLCHVCSSRSHGASLASTPRPPLLSARRSGSRLHRSCEGHGAAIAQGCAPS